MNLREKVILDKIINNNVSVVEQKSALLFHTILFVLGWVSGVVDFSNFYSDIPSIIQLAIFILIILFPFFTILSTYKLSKNNERVNFISAFIILSSYYLKRTLITFAFIIIAYVVAFTILKEFFNLVFYEVQYYFSIIIILLIEIVYFRKMIKYFKLIYGGKNE